MVSAVTTGPPALTALTTSVLLPQWPTTVVTSLTLDQTFFLYYDSMLPDQMVVHGPLADPTLSGYTVLSADQTVSCYAIFTWNKANDQISYTWNGPSGVAPITSSLLVHAAATNKEESSGSNTPASATASTSVAASNSGSVPTASATTTGASNSTSNISPLKDSTGGLSNGAVAGVAVGCLIAGALIAGLLAWCFFRRRQPRGSKDSEVVAMGLMHREKGPTAKTMSLESGSPIAMAMESGLPQPLEDKAISGEISKISNLIKNHVQSYYHTGRVSPGMIDYDDIQALGSDLPVSTGTLSTLLGNSATREIALRFCIAWVVVSRMQLSAPPNTTFLPPEVAECFQSMSLVERGSRVHSVFFTKWRAITAELMQSTYIRNPFSANDPRLHNIEASATVLDNILRPYSDSRMDNGQRSRNLEEILKRAALFAFTLFSQPSGWDFDWQTEQNVKTGSLCIFPALVQVSNENGDILKPPRPFSEAVVRRLDD